MKVLIIGLDGVSFNLLSPLIAHGKMPYLKSLIENGIGCTLQSTIPPDSCPAWPSILTGKNPGKHGMFDFLQKKGYEIVPTKPHYPKGTALWDLISNSGKTIGFINVPLTYPPPKINGFIVSGMPVPSNSNYTYPEFLLDELHQIAGDYEVDIPEESSPKAMLDSIYLMERKRVDVTIYLLDKYNPDFLMIVFTGTDRIQHYFWNYLKANHNNGDVNQKNYPEKAFTFFKEIDQYIRWICEKAGRKANIFVISDHGHGPVKKYVNLNIWLIKKGYLKLKDNLSTKLKWFMTKSGLNAKKAYRLLRRLGLSGLRRNAKESTFLSKISNNLFLSLMNDVDWLNTKAFYAGIVGWGSIYLNLKGREPLGIIESDEYEAIRNTLIEDLLKMTDEDTGEKIIAEVYKKEKIYRGPHTYLGPDLICRPIENYSFFYAHTFMSSRVFEKPFAITGDHVLNGILIASGPDIAKKGFRSELVFSVLDIAPTVLHMLSERIPVDMDGKIMMELFAPNSPVLKREPIFYSPEIPKLVEDSWTEEDKKEIEERLRAIGYLG